MNVTMARWCTCECGSSDSASAKLSDLIPTSLGCCSMLILCSRTIKYVADLRSEASSELSLQAVKRQLRPPTAEESEDILYYVSVRHRRKLWKLLSKGIQVYPSISRQHDEISTLVRAIEANYVELADDYVYPDTVQALLWAQCDPNHSSGGQRLLLSQAIRSGDDRAGPGLPPTSREPDENAPLLLASQVGSPTYVRLLLKHRADPGVTESLPQSESSFSSCKGQSLPRRTASELASSFPDIVATLREAKPLGGPCSITDTGDPHVSPN